MSSADGGLTGLAARWDGLLLHNCGGVARKHYYARGRSAAFSVLPWAQCHGARSHQSWLPALVHHLGEQHAPPATAGSITINKRGGSSDLLGMMGPSPAGGVVLWHQQGAGAAAYLALCNSTPDQDVPPQ